MRNTGSVFNNKVVLLTGHTGFKGSWLSIWLHKLGAKVVGISNDVPTTPSNFSTSSIKDIIDDYRADICNPDQIRSIVLDVQPDFVFHLAAQALVRLSYKKPLETMATNAMGTANVLDALTCLDKQVVSIMITSDKAYDNLEWVWGYRETDRLGGSDPYSASKGMAELAIKSYYESFFNNRNSNVRLGIARAGNVIGGGDWANDRIVPDCMKAWSKNQIVDIRSPNATRPWQHVLEPLSGYLALASDLEKSNRLHGEAYNFGPQADQNKPVHELINEMGKYWDSVRWNDVSQSQEHFHEAGLLKLNCDKALSDLRWLPTLQFEETVRMTVEWYKTYYQNQDGSMYSYTIEQIEEYTRLAQMREIMWAIP